MHKDLLLTIEELEQAVEARDGQAAADILGRLKEKTIYSGNEVYERLHAVEGKLGVVLFEGLQPAEFGQLIANDGHLYDFEIWAALEKISERVSVKALWQIKDSMGFPSHERCPKLYAKLAEADDEKISENLIETIDKLSSAEAAEGSDLSRHQRTMSTFRFIRWGPDDKRLSEHVHLLATRSDEHACMACKRYLMELPWGVDRQATLALLNGMCAKREAQNLAIFKQALTVHRQPAVLRTWLWGAIGETSPRECVLGVIGDLATADNNPDRMIFMEHLDAYLPEEALQNHRLDRGEIISAAEGVDTRNWSWLLRGCYGSLLKTVLPKADVSRVSNGLERAAISVARVWEMVRLDHMGCLIPLALMIAMGWLVNYGLSKLLGAPLRAPWLPVAFFWGWIAWSLVNVRTHFSGHETIAYKVCNGAVYFALLIGALLAAVLVRIS